ncbi:MAG: hypothetical protein IJY28_03080, partial [Clostridia bacterium]|nr:hypothetical protein [Clostridia bacterium]
WLCMVIYWLGLQMTGGQQSYTPAVLDLLYRAHSQIMGFMFMVICVVPSLAYTATFTTDYRTKMLNFWCIRGGSTAYGVSYYLTALFSAFGVSVGGNLLYIVVNLLRGFPLTSGSAAMGSAYPEVFATGNMVLYVAVILADFGLGAMVCAALAAAAGSVFRRRFAVYGIPLLIVHSAYMLHLPPMLDLQELTADLSGIGCGDFQNFFGKLIGVLCYGIIAGIITVRGIERSVEHG